MILSGISAVINIILDPPIFIFTFNWGGIAGAAWATLASRALLAVVGIMLLFGKKTGCGPVSVAFSLTRKSFAKL